MGAHRFHDLIPYRVREILLVSSPYDAFILEEDGRLSEQLYTEFRALDLSSPPRVHQASSAKEALKRLEGAYFDLILVMSSLADHSVNEFARSVRRLYPKKAIVYLALRRLRFSYLILGDGDPNRPQNLGLLDAALIGDTEIFPQ